MAFTTRLSGPKLALRAALVAGLVALLAGPVCGALTPPLSVGWINSMGPEPRNVGEVLVRGGLVYVSHSGILRCLDARTGGEVWRLEFEEARVSTAPVAWRNRVIVGADDGNVYALDAVTGEEVWRRELGNRVSPDPVLAGDALVLGAGSMAFSLDPETGQANWACSLTSPASAPAVSDGSMLYFLCQDGSIQSIDQGRGAYRWRVLPQVGADVSRPVYASRRVIVAGGRRLAAVSRSGKVVWTADMPVNVTGRPTVVGETLYVPCSDGEIYRLYVRSGRQERGATLKAAGAVTAAPLIDGDLVIAGTSSGLVCALVEQSGATRWQYRCRAPDEPIGQGISFGLYAPPVSAEGALYCLTGTGDLYCFTASAPDRAGPVFSEFDPEPGDALSSEIALTVSFTVLDDGSGLVPDSVGARVDGAAFPVGFDPASGVAFLHLGTLPEGPHVVDVFARDYRGNTSEDSWSFLTDKSIPPPAVQPLPQPGAPGGGMMGGGGRRGIP